MSPHPQKTKRRSLREAPAGRVRDGGTPSALEPFEPEIYEIERLAPGGEGIAHRSNGEVLFVAATAPGDRVEVGDLRRVQGVLRGRLSKLVARGPDRRDPPCRYAHECGGCDFMHLAPEAQRVQKMGMLSDALTRIGGRSLSEIPIDFVASDSPVGYRSRLRLHVDENGRVGLLSSRSHRVVPIANCLVADPKINGALEGLAALDSESKKRLSYCEQIELRSSEHAPNLSVRLVPRLKSQLRPDRYAPLFPKDASVVVARSPEEESSTQSFAVTADLRIDVPLAAFSQVNLAVNRRLVEAVVRAATLRDLRTFVDAYAGAGNFALPLLHAGLHGEAVDTCGAGILAARRHARDHALPFSGFSVGNASHFLEQFVSQRRQFDYVVLDPPRQGAKSVLSLALRLRPRAIALVGCDPVALARDLGTLSTRGACVDSLTLFDMFPETHHTETLAIIDCDAVSSP